jgi:hypothetical protein
MENIFKDENIRDLLEDGLKRIDRKWGHYCRYNEEVTRELRQAGVIVDLRGIERGIRDEGKRWGYLVKNILDLNPEEQILLISSRLLPDYNHMRFSKKGNLAKVPRRGEKDVEKAIYDMLNNVKTTDLYVGLDWQGRHSSTGEYRVMRLNDCFKKHKVKKHLGTALRDLKVKAYPGNHLTRGVTLDVHTVPSTSSRKVYTVMLKHVAAYKNEREREQVANISYDLKADHEKCGSKKWYTVKDTRGNERSIFAHEREGDEILIDLHDLLAIEAGKLELKRHGLKVIDPCIDPARIRFGLKFHDRLPYVIKEVREGKKMHRHHLDNLDNEILCWKLIGYNNFPKQNRK